MKAEERAALRAWAETLSWISPVHVLELLDALEAAKAENERLKVLDLADARGEFLLDTANCDHDFLCANCDRCSECGWLKSPTTVTP